MLNLQICTVIIMTKKNIKKKKIIKNQKKKKKKKKKIMRSPRIEPGTQMGSKSPTTSTTPRRPMRVTDKNNQYIIKL